MTIGQKIAQKRKELGLSQEALGEQLGVSRQAIYKWESDTSLPEIEKLISLSRIFSVSVGWLLGEEEAPSEDAPPPSQELSEEQLRMVEEIVSRYLAAQPAPTASKRRRWPLVTAGIAAAVAVVVIFRLYGQISQLNNQYASLQTSIQTVNRSVNDQISSITNQVESILKSQNQLTASYDAQLTSADLAQNTVTFSVQAVPKTYVDGMEAVFWADSGDGPVEFPGTLEDRQEFTAQITCPLTDLITLSVVFQTGDTRETQVLQQFYDLYSESLPNLTVDGSLWGYTKDGLLSSLAIDCSLNSSGSSSFAINAALGQAAVAQLQVGLFQDQQLVVWYDALDEQPDTIQGDYGDARFFQRPELTLDVGHIYCEAALVTDEYGRSFMVWDVPVQLNETKDFFGSVDVSYSRDPGEWTYQ